jgi:hypothetical protein
VPLARQAVRIKEQNHGINHPLTASSLSTLSDILRLLNGNDDELKDLLERCLAINIKREGIDGHNVAMYNFDLGRFHHEVSMNMSSFGARIEQLHLAVSFLNEAIRIATKVYGPHHQITLQFEEKIAKIMESLDAEMHAKVHAEASMKCSGCEKPTTSKCSDCKTEAYCGIFCQKKDWKFHKGMCPFMKEGAKLLPFPKVYSCIVKLKKKANTVKDEDNKIRVLKYCLLFAESQYGDRIVGKGKCERDGYGTDNLGVDQTLLGLYSSIGFCYQIKADRYSEISFLKDTYAKTIYYYEKLLSITMS